MKSLSEIFLMHHEIIDVEGEKIIKFKDSKETKNVTTTKKTKRKSNSGNVK